MPTNQLNRSDIMDYSFSSAAWSDCHSAYALSWPDAERGGLQALHSLRMHGGLEITKNFLNWDLREDGGALKSEFQSRLTYPERVIETAQAEGISLKVTMSWPERNTLHLHFDIRNDSDSARALELSFDYEAKTEESPGPGGHGPRVACEGGRRTYYRRTLSPLFGYPDGSWLCVFDYCEDADAEAIDKRKISGMDYAIYCIADLTDRRLQIEPGQTQSLDLVLAFGSSWPDARARFQAYASGAKSWTTAQATRRTEALLAQAPAIDPDFAGDADLEKLYTQAIAGLNSLYIAGDDGLAGKKRIPWTCKHVLAGGFFWDTAFASAGGVWINPEAAKESIEAFCEHPNNRGALPANLTDRALGGEGQYPIMTWGAWNIFAATGDRDWLARCLPSLERHVEHWFTFYSREDGRCYIYNSYLGNDDDARFDYCMKGLYNQPVDKIDSPDINAMLVVELQALGKMHDALGNAEAAATFQKRAETLNGQIVTHYYFAEEKAFLDTEEGSREIKSGVLTPHMFLPLWADTPLAKEAVKEIVETHMLDPDKFYREHPFPSLPFNHPEYDPEGYWRGRIWPHMVFWMCQTLWLQGYQKESNTVARNLLKMMLKTPWICENYNSETGNGWNPDNYRGWPAYNWCYATVILLMSGAHKQPPLPGTE